jgi:serine/threonine-protein kinase
MDDDLGRFEFGEYEIVGELGRGAMGVVYRARQRELGREVALKLVHRHVAADPEAFARFQREARAASQVNDPGLVAVHEAGAHHGQWYIAMELVEGRGLDEVVGDGPLEARRAAELLADVARAVDRLHQAGIVHRDLKPGNVLIDPSGRPRLTDFGLAKFEGDVGAASTGGTIVGTPAYLAPEQVTARFGPVGPRADVYGLGAILYELLTGRPPRGGTKDDSALRALVAAAEHVPIAPRALRPAIPVDLERVCLRCLERRPEDRYPSARALARDLEQFLSGQPTDAAPPGAVARLRRWARRRPALAVRLAGVAAFWGLALVDYAVLAVSSSGFFGEVSLLLGGWAAFSLALERLARRRPRAAAYLWAGADWVLFTAILLTGDGAASPMVVVYPLLVLVSASWLRERIVAFVTALALASYGVLVVDGASLRPDLTQPFDHHLLVAVTIVVTGSLVATQVRRTRNLLRYAARRWR